MPQALWKKKAIADREDEILSVARGMLLKAPGIHGRTMEGLAEATPYSKGTIYLHFASKDDLLSGLWIRPLRTRLDLYRRAAVFRGKSRERIVAIEVARRVVLQLHPESDLIEGEIYSGQGTVSPKRSAEITSIATEISGISLGIISDAIAEGDLPGGDGEARDKIYIALRSLWYGLTHGWNSTVTLRSIKERAGPEMPLRLATAFLDGLQWKPLSTDWDYAKTVERIWMEVFPEEARKMGLGR